MSHTCTDPDTTRHTRTHERNTDMAPRCPGTLTATSTIVWEHPIQVTGTGDLEITGPGEAIDVLDAYDLWCAECGPAPLTASEYERHGIADDWQML
jgi:hypothetical protein